MKWWAIGWPQKHTDHKMEMHGTPITLEEESATDEHGLQAKEVCLRAATVGRCYDSPVAGYRTLSSEGLPAGGSIGHQVAKQIADFIHGEALEKFFRHERCGQRLDGIDLVAL